MVKEEKVYWQLFKNIQCVYFWGRIRHCWDDKREICRKTALDIRRGDFRYGGNRTVGAGTVGS